MSTVATTPTGSLRPALSGAWFVVGLLWLVALLNYLDRLLLVSMRESIVHAIPMTDAQFGLLTSLFLWVYGFASPLGGFLADKLGRKWVIFSSLLIWSALTWLTSHVTTLNELLLVRAAMGFSEAFYIPAALALICDYHRGSTRSLATGIHYSGIFAGAALSGIGGYLAEAYSWQMAFSIFGFFGVGYSVVIGFFLKDAPAERVSVETAAPVDLRRILLEILTSAPFWMLLVLNAFVGMANWLVYTWMPTYLREGFNLSQSSASLLSTVVLQVATVLAVLAGGIWADRWCRRDSRARAFVPAIGYLLAAPALFATGSTSLIGVAVLGIAIFGLGRGFYDANIMPILREVVNERYSATAFGVLNLTSCLVGGGMIYVGGVVRDRNIPTGLVYQGAALGLLITTVLLLLVLRRSKTARGPV
jgi:MFS family permease